MTGLYVLLAALAAATVFGLVWQRRDGRIRPAGTTRSRVTRSGATPTDASRSGVTPSGADPAGTDPAGSSDPAGTAGSTDPAGTDPATDATGSTDPAVDPALLSALGVTPGPQVTLLQFSSAFCAPCRTTRVVLADVARSVDGVRHVEVDAESHLDAVRALGILRTPTTLVLDGEGRIRGRASGAPRKDDVLAALRPLFGTDVPQRGSDEGPPGRV